MANVPVDHCLPAPVVEYHREGPVPASRLYIGNRRWKVGFDAS